MSVFVYTMSPSPDSFISSVWSTDQQGICTRATVHADGVLPAMQGRRFADWLACVQADADCVTGVAIAGAMGSRQAFRHEHRIRCGDQQVRWVLTTGIPRFDASGGFDGFDGAIIDMTAAVEERRQALRSGAEARIIVDNCKDLIAHCDAHGNYVHVSQSYTDVIGWEAHEMVGQAVTGFLHPDDQERAAAALVRVFSGKEVAGVVEVHKRHRDGRYIALGTTVRAVREHPAGRVVGAIIVSRDITREKEMLQRLEWLATHDTLTGLPNRAWFNRHLAAVVADTDTHGNAVFFIDLNRFKAVNDTLGHAAGDQLLQQVSQRLQACMRPGDVVARLGGDEFVAAARCSDRAAAAAIARRLIASLEAPFQVDGMVMQVGASVGISMADGQQVDAQALFRNADQAMYRAKAAGESAYRFFDLPAEEDVGLASA